MKRPDARGEAVDEHIKQDGAREHTAFSLDPFVPHRLLISKPHFASSDALRDTVVGLSDRLTLGAGLSGAVDSGCLIVMARPR
jgi:hypothetical protein